jgi:hypothetical protein
MNMPKLDKIIFLDIDGVLNSEKAYLRGDCKYVEWEWEDGTKEHHQSFCPVSKLYINHLIKITEAKVVISSTWRHSGLDFMKKIWEVEEMAGEIIGITPSFRGEVDGYAIPRGCEIEKWLEDKGFSHINWSIEKQQDIVEKSGIENYIIIDDDSDMLYSQRNHFVHVLPSPRNKSGFNEEYLEQATLKLEKSVIDLNYS